MANPRFEGSGVAIVTPFDDSGINEVVFRELVRFHEREGTDAIVVCGSTGEAAVMTPEEHRRAVEIVVDEVNGRMPVIAGCGGSGTVQVSALAAGARDAGADGLLLSAPPYNKPPQKGMIAHFRAIMEAADLPAILYNVPSRTAVNISPETIAELADDERVIGVKEASGDISQVADLARVTEGRLALWSGNDDQVLPLLAFGGAGVITVLGNVAPGPVSRMVHAFHEGDIETARNLQLRFLPLIRELFATPNPIPVKAAVARLGFEVGEPRLPLVPMDEGAHGRLVAALREAGVEREGAVAEPQAAGVASEAADVEVGRAGVEREAAD